MEVQEDQEREKTLKDAHSASSDDDKLTEDRGRNNL